MVDRDSAATPTASASAIKNEETNPDESPSQSQPEYSPGQQSPPTERPTKHRRKTSNFDRLLKQLSEDRVGLEIDQKSRRFTNAKRYQRPGLHTRDSASSFDNASPSQTRSVTPETSQQTTASATPTATAPATATTSGAAAASFTTSKPKKASIESEPNKPKREKAAEPEFQPNKPKKSTNTARRDPPQQQPIMSRRDRGGGRNARNNGSNANNDSGGEEAALWESIKTKDIPDFIKSFNEESKDLDRLCELDKEAGSKDPEKVTRSMLTEMDQLCRSGVKSSDANIAKLKETIERLNILKGLVAANEKTEEKLPAKRGSQRDAAAAAALYDFDGTGDSPVPSPLGAGTTRSKAGERASAGNRDRDRDRDSIGPKASSVEPSAAGTPAPSGPNPARSKVVFVKGESVAFKPKVNNGEAGSDWILGEVAQVVGEGKSRRYKVLDIEPDDQSKQKEYKTSASSMIPITPEAQAGSLADWEPHTTVLALYPNTTTFYKAEVDSMDDKGRVNLKFEGEQDNSTLQQVERRFVIEFRA